MKRTVQSPKKIKQFLVALLAVLLVIGAFPVGANLLTKAVTKDGHTTALPGEVTLGEYSSVGASLSAPTDIAQGQWVTYGFGDKTYLYEAKFPIAAGETLTLTGDGSTLELDRGGNTPAATRVNDLVEVSENAGVHTLSLKDGETLNAGETYYYDLGGGEYYLFTPEQTLGGDDTATDRPRYLASSSYSTYYAGKPDRKGEQIAVVIDTNRHTLNYSGDQYTKHFIFQRASGLSSGQIYLIGRRGAVSGGSAPMSLIGMGSQHSTTKKDEGSKCSYTTPSYASRAMSGRELQNGTSLYSYNGSGFSGLSGNNYYIDAGTATSSDALKNAELFASSASTNNNVVSGLVSVGNLSGYRLTAVNAANNGYTDDRAFGSVYTWTKSVEQELIYHHYCETVDSVGLALINVNMSHNNGMVWAYSGNQLYNNNTMAGVNLSGGSRYLALSGGTWTAVDSSNTATTVYPYNLVVAYEKKAAALEQPLTVYSQNTGVNTLEAIPMEKVSAELTYAGVKGDISFDITYRLTTEDGRTGVNGTFGDVVFTDGVGVKTGVTNGSTFNLGWVPEGYKLATTSVLPSDTSDPDSKRYQKALSYEDASGTHDWAEGNGNAFPVGAAPTSLKYEMDDPLRTVRFGLTHNGTGSHLDDTYDLTPYVLDETGAPYNGVLHDRLGRTFTFVNGSPDSATQKFFHLGKGKSISLVDVPNGFHFDLTTTSSTLANVSISEGDLGSTKTVLTQKGGTATVGKKVATWSVDGVTVDTDEDFLVSIVYQNYTTTIEYHFLGAKTNVTFQYEFTFVVKQEDASSPGGWKTVTDIGLKNTTGTATKNADGSFTIKRSGISRSKVQDITYNKFTLSNIPPDARLFVTHSATGTFESSQSAVLRLISDDTLTDVTKSNFTGNFTKTFSLPRLKPEFELDPSQASHRLDNDFLLNSSIARFNVKTTLLHGDPSLEVPVNLAGFTYTKNLPNSGSTSNLTNDTGNKVMSSNYKKGALSVKDITVNNKTLVSQYAVGSANVLTLKVGEIQRNGTGIVMEMEDQQDLAFSTNSMTAEYATYLSPFIKTVEKNSNGVPYNKLGSELVAQPGYKLVDIVFQTGKNKTVSNPATTVKYEEYAHSKETVGEIEIIYDIIPQDVHISLVTGKNDGAKDYANRSKKFPVDISLLNGNDMPVYGQIYEYTDADGNDGYLLFDSEKGVQIVNGVTKDSHGRITGYTETGKKPELKHGDEIVLKLPYQYTVVVDEEDPGNYVDTYEAWTSANPTKVPENRVKVDSVLDAQSSYLQIKNTRNGVEDEIGIFGGKANRAFLALVSGLSIAAAAAYLYARREEAKE